MTRKQFDIRSIVKAVQDSLSPELLKPQYREDAYKHPHFGHCYAAAEAVYHMAGGKKAGLTAMHINHKGGSHWYLRKENGQFLDPTEGQFPSSVPYKKGKGMGFLTKQPSIRAKVIIERAKKILKQRETNYEISRH